MPLLQAAQRSPEWFAARKGKLTASLAAACLGFDKYCSKQKAYRSIIGTHTETENKHMRWGSEFEAAARQAYECETGNLVEETGFWIHPDHPWLGASPDGLIGSDGAIEIKCPSKHPEKVPINHRIQMIVQMACTGRRWCDYATFACTDQSLGMTLVVRRIVCPPTSGLILMLKAFYVNYVMTMTEPPRKRRKTNGKGKSETTSEEAKAGTP